MKKKAPPIAVITGGGSGIGRQTALQLSSKGFTTVIIGRRKKQLQTTASKISKVKGTAPWYVADIRDERSIKEIIGSISEKFRKIDVLINNAGVPGEGVLIHETDTALWNEIIDTNINGIFRITREILPVMMKQQSGSIINIASIAPVIAMRKAAAYCASKAAVIALSRSIAYDYHSYGISCNCVSPGTIDTEMTSHLLSNRHITKSLTEMIPLKRIGKPKDVAELICYLALEGRHLTGNIISIDGGLSL